MTIALPAHSQGIAFDLGQRWLMVLAFPLSAEILEVQDTSPTAEVIVGVGLSYLRKGESG
ncbi:MAG TPA: hypothetical protein PKH77_21395 [Anaerolineae bacterium]|nr:hypothetical protein [Anaerolineae bacterium]